MNLFLPDVFSSVSDPPCFTGISPVLLLGTELVQSLIDSIQDFFTVTYGNIPESVNKKSRVNHV